MHWKRAEVFVAVSYTHLDVYKRQRVSEASKNKVHVTKSKSGIVVKGIDDMAVRFSRCCNPCLLYTSICVEERGLCST